MKIILVPFPSLYDFRKDLHALAVPTVLPGVSVNTLCFRRRRNGLQSLTLKIGLNTCFTKIHFFCKDAYRGMIYWGDGIWAEEGVGAALEI